MKTTNYVSNRIDRRHTYILVIDTETANTLSYVNDKGKGQMDMSNVLFYDFGGIVADTAGNVYERFSLVNADIYLREAELMQSAYYANKLPLYADGLKNGSRTMATTLGMKFYIQRLCEAYEIKIACAHNARFDKNALDTTLRYVTKSEYRYFLPYGVEWWDTMVMARSVIHKMPTYRKFCEEHNLLTANGRLSTTAENLYRFIIKDVDFVESHTGLEDVEIEFSIMRYCYRQHKPMEKRLYKNAFPIVENTAFQIALLHSIKENPVIF